MAPCTLIKEELAPCKNYTNDQIEVTSEEYSKEIDVTKDESNSSASKSRGEVVIAHELTHAKHLHHHCVTCNNQFTSKERLLIHQRIHNGEKPFQCRHCDECFEYRTNLIVHQRIHSGRKTYYCNKCDKGFASRGALVKHQLLNTDEKPDQCLKGLPRSGALFSHRNNRDKWFARKSPLRFYHRTLTGDKPYKCDQCEKSFERNGLLQMHKRIHKGVKPYPCDQCDKKFSQRKALLIHQKIHNRDLTL